MPSVGTYKWMIDLLKEIGPRDIDWGTLNQWCEFSGVNLSYWEGITLVKLSKLFSYSVSMYHNENAVSPTVADVSDPEAMDRNIKSILRQPVMGAKK